MTGAAPRIELASQKHLEDVRNGDEDWSGKADAKERRRLQNRLHQRAWRRRKAEAQDSATQKQCQREVGRSKPTLQTLDDGPVSAAFAQATAALVPQPVRNATNIINERYNVPGKASQSGRTACGGGNANVSVQKNPALLPGGFCRDAAEIVDKQLPPIIRFLYARTAPSFYFPLAPDYHLITLIQYNVMRAVISNLSVCSLIQEIPARCEAAVFIPAFEPPSSLPPNFEPTEYQLSTPHPPWMNSIPCPRFRENLIRANLQGLYSQDELCEDICGGLFEGYDDTERKGLLVWGEPWQTASWEISDGFAQKWGWLLKGCEEMVAATNRWRESRGEERMVVEIE